MTAPLTIADAATAMGRGELTASGLTEHFLARTAAHNEALGAYVTVAADRAREAAAALDEEREAGSVRGPLHGIPLAVKDIIATADAPTYGNSRITDDGWNPGVDATVVERLRTAGCIVLGKTTTNEFASGLGDPSKGFATPYNPWDVERTPSGSSSGSGVAIAAELALAALGSDTGGSIRAPAAACGVTGFKPTFGRVPKTGVIPLGWTLDTVGPLTHSARDAAYLLDVMAGPDGIDVSTPEVPVSSYSDALTGDVTGVRIGIPEKYFYDSPSLATDVRQAVLDAVAVLEKGGAVIVPTEVPLAKESRDANTLLWVCDGFTYHRSNLVTRWNDFGRPTRTLLSQAAFYSSADYLQAQRVQARFRHELARVFGDVDVLLVPTGLEVAERFVDMSLDRRRLGPNFLAQWSFGGNPVVAAPCGLDADGIPYSLQVVGPAFGDATVLRVVDAYQRLTDHHLRTAASKYPTPEGDPSC